MKNKLDARNNSESNTSRNITTAQQSQQVRAMVMGVSKIIRTEGCMSAFQAGLEAEPPCSCGMMHEGSRLLESLKMF